VTSSTTLSKDTFDQMCVHLLDGNHDLHHAHDHGHVLDHHRNCPDLFGR
jgi:hypothetical protein